MSEKIPRTMCSVVYLQYTTNDSDSDSEASDLGLLHILWVR